MAADKAHASPTKEFFVSMITRDISLADCILDLLDNSIDGARRVSGADKSQRLDGFEAKIVASKELFSISDNCGGISRSDAEDYAFHFGRREDDTGDVEGAIGIYGIGMKRAIFKMGKKASVISRPTTEEPFSVEIDVDEWINRRDEHGREDWDFDIRPVQSEKTSPGTEIILSRLHPAVESSFSDGTFINELIKTAARDYAFLIQRGFVITINGTKVPDYQYALKSGGEIEPLKVVSNDGNVNVEIVAGLIRELDDEISEDLKPEKVERFGWYVICNERVVIAADKSDRTVWGRQDANVWHPQYNGFAGFLFLSAKNPAELPWTTTKRSIEPSDPLYLRCVAKMQEITQQFIDYTNARKADLEVAKQAEKTAPTVAVTKLVAAPLMKLPRLTVRTIDVDNVTISFRRPRQEVKEVAEALGNFAMAPSDVGKQTFAYFRKMELGK